MLAVVLCCIHFSHSDASDSLVWAQDQGVLKHSTATATITEETLEQLKINNYELDLSAVTLEPIGSPEAQPEPKALTETDVLAQIKEELGSISKASLLDASTINEFQGAKTIGMLCGNIPFVVVLQVEATVKMQVVAEVLNVPRRSLRCVFH